MTVGRAQVGEFRPEGCVAVLDEISRGVADVSGAEVEPEHRLTTEPLAVVEELVGAELIRLDLLPREFAAARAPVARADAVAPVVVADEVPAGVPQDGEVQVLQRGQHVLAVAALVGMGGGVVIYALINAPAHVFREAAEKQRRDLAD